MCQSKDGPQAGSLAPLLWKQGGTGQTFSYWAGRGRLNGEHRALVNGQPGCPIETRLNLSFSSRVRNSSALKMDIHALCFRNVFRIDLLALRTSIFWVSACGSIAAGVQMGLQRRDMKYCAKGRIEK